MSLPSSPFLCGPFFSVPDPFFRYARILHRVPLGRGRCAGPSTLFSCSLIRPFHFFVVFHLFGKSVHLFFLAPPSLIPPVAFPAGRSPALLSTHSTLSPPSLLEMFFSFFPRSRSFVFYTTPSSIRYDWQAFVGRVLHTSPLTFRCLLDSSSDSSRPFFFSLMRFIYLQIIPASCRGSPSSTNLWCLAAIFL